MNDTETYCRAVESYLCRKNDGHLIRIVGPAFDQVRGWESRGIPLKVVYRGVDRYFERYYAKGPRRRPVRVEFCEADVMDAFDNWRRAVGVGVGDDGSSVETPDAANGSGATRSRESLATHLEKVVARLAARRAGADRSLDSVLDEVVRELDGARATSKTLRGERRDAMLQRLRELDGRLVEAARAGCDAETLRCVHAEAEQQLAPFRGRMPPSAYEQSHRACVDRLLREHARLPTIAFD